MPETHLKFHSSNGKRQVLIVQDEIGASDSLKDMMKDKYDLLTVSDGEEMMSTIIRKRDILSLIILNITPPERLTLDMITILKSEQDLARIPVIVTSADREKEAQSLLMGAMDFIPKPYPPQDVILARVRRAIELSEDREIISLTERDSMTGLYNREFFYRYAVQFDAYHRSMSMDAIVVDVNHFRMINERYGKNIGDEVIRQIGQNLRTSVADAGGIVCRRNGDTFLIYCPHRTDYAEILDNAAMIKGDRNIHVRLRMGVYPEVDKTLDIERRFDHAKMAADSRRGNYSNRIGFYDKALHDEEILREHLLEEFSGSLEKEQFLVFYQPKFDIRQSEPVLNSAEALVRWNHPELGLIGPERFIPLFEDHGLIQELDNYVWRKVASQMAAWHEKYGRVFPVSVNVSRIDMYDPDFIDTISALVKEFGIRYEDFLLEITESAYTQDSEQIIENVKKLREAGFLIEMDDFGSGYSSLNMISTLPIDVIKLDMQFIRNAFKEHSDTRMLEAVLGIADSLYVPTVAEGVETSEQLNALKSMGCDIAQGYYFSKPVPPDQYEFFIEQRLSIEDKIAPIELSHRMPHLSYRDYNYDALHDPLTGLYNNVAFEMLVKDADRYHTALLVAEVVDVERIVSEEGQIAAEAVLKHTAGFLKRSFRPVDHICRISSKEFAIIMSRVDSSIQDQVSRKIERINELLRKPENGLPAVSLAVGVAFADRSNPGSSILDDAMAALSKLKEQGEVGCSFH